MAKPEPISKYIVCSECGLSWENHKKKSIDECVRLLKAELARRPRLNQYGTTWAQPNFINASSQ